MLSQCICVSIVEFEVTHLDLSKYGLWLVICYGLDACVIFHTDTFEALISNVSAGRAFRKYLVLEEHLR